MSKLIAANTPRFELVSTPQSASRPSWSRSPWPEKYRSKLSSGFAVSRKLANVVLSSPHVRFDRFSTSNSPYWACVSALSITVMSFRGPFSGMNTPSGSLYSQLQTMRAR